VYTLAGSARGGAVGIRLPLRYDMSRSCLLSRGSPDEGIARSSTQGPRFCTGAAGEGLCGPFMRCGVGQNRHGGTVRLDATPGEGFDLRPHPPYHANCGRMILRSRPGLPRFTYHQSRFFEEAPLRPPGGTTKKWSGYQRSSSRPRLTTTTPRATRPTPAIAASATIQASPKPVLPVEASATDELLMAELFSVLLT
jgi:hypothetical protein